MRRKSLWLPEQTGMLVPPMDRRCCPALWRRQEQGARYQPLPPAASAGFQLFSRLYECLVQPQACCLCQIVRLLVNQNDLEITNAETIPYRKEPKCSFPARNAAR